MIVFEQIKDFLLKHCRSSDSLLLALSGGVDSLCLFYGLLHFRKNHGISFHVAHIDHGWRKESQDEAIALQELCTKYEVPFHLKTIQPCQLVGNLEAACRKVRYAFFSELSKEKSFQAVLTAHHLDDQAETIFKRILEGSHWSRFSGLREEHEIEGVKVLRPLLGIRKKKLEETLFKINKKAFEDPTNTHLQFLRARLREILFPRLNKEFGKNVESNLAIFGNDAQELIEYFDARLTPLIAHEIVGPFGYFLDLQSIMPQSLLEIKYLLRLLCRKDGYFLSREIIDQAALALHFSKANRLFIMGRRQMIIDRKRIFALSPSLINSDSFPLSISQDVVNRSMERGSATFMLGNWKIQISEATYYKSREDNCWKECWKGEGNCFLPQGSYFIGFSKSLKEAIPHSFASIKKILADFKIPSFLLPFFPFIWTNEKICHEFLTGKPRLSLKEGEPCWEIKLYLNTK